MRIHFIAIGGAAMHNLALDLASKGHIITGSDDEIFEPSRSRLEKAGLLPENAGWFPEKINTNLDAIVLGMHARDDNPEMKRALELNIKIYSYPEFLYEQTRTKQRVVIAGSHGKTTVTSMIMHVLKNAGLKFDYMVGSQIQGFEYMVSLSSDAKIAIFEGDEYLTSPLDPRPKFHIYKPHIAVINGIAWDHINVFPTFEGYCLQFEKFINLIEPDGSLYYYNEDKEILKILNNSKRQDIASKGFSTHPNRKTQGNQVLLDEKGNGIDIELFGNHNMQNISAAKLVCNQLGVTNEVFYSAISTFQGSAKRLQILLDTPKRKAYLDFAHAPSKVIATVEAVRNQYPGFEFIACFELHTFSSLSKKFLKEYKNTLSQADVAIVYFNPEVMHHKKLPVFDKQDVKDSFSMEGLLVITNISELETLIAKLPSRDKKVFLYMSSGNFGGLKTDDLCRIACI